MHTSYIFVLCMDVDVMDASFDASFSFTCPFALRVNTLCFSYYLGRCGSSSQLANGNVVRVAFFPSLQLYITMK